MFLRILTLLFPLLLTVQKGISQTFLCNAMAFSKTSISGNRPADDIALSVKDYFAYLETSKKASFSIQNIWLNKALYEATVTSVADEFVSAGRDKNRKEIKIKAAPGNVIHFVQLQKAGAQKKVPAKFQKLKAGTMLIEFFHKGKTSYAVVPVIDLGIDLSVG